MRVPFNWPDVSGNNTSVDVRAVAKRSPLIAIKATEGMNFRSSSFPARWKEARRRGMVRIAYHFAHVSQDRPKGEADQFFNFVRANGLYRGDILCLDAESGGGSARNARRWMGDFLSHLDARSHAHAQIRPAWIYAGEWFREHCSPGRVDRYLWLSAYVRQSPRPFIPEQFRHNPNLFAAWQFTDGQSGYGPHSFPGVGQCDVNQFQGDVRRLHAVAGTPVVRRLTGAVRRRI